MRLFSNQYGHLVHRKVLSTTLGVVLCVSWNMAGAYDWSSDYGVSLTLGIEDNYRLTTEDETDTTSAEAGVFTSITGADETTRLQFTLGAREKRFSESSIDDQTTYNMGFNGSKSAERLLGRLSVSYRQESTTETELLDSGDNRDGERKTTAISPGVDYQLDERNTLSADYSFQDVSYDTVSLTEYTNNSLSLGWSHQLDETTRVSTGFTHTVYDPDDDDSTDVDSVNLGYGFQTSAATNYNLTVGLSNIDRPEGSETSGTGAFNVTHQTDDRNSFTLALSKDYEGSGDGEVRETDRVNLLWNHALSETTQTTVFAEGANNSADDDANNDDRTYYTVGAGANYNYTREINLSADYRFRIRDENNNAADADNAKSNSLFFTVSYSPL